MKGQHTPEFLIKHNALIQERTRQREEKNKARLVRRVERFNSIIAQREERARIREERFAKQEIKRNLKIPEYMKTDFVKAKEVLDVVNSAWEGRGQPIVALRNKSISFSLPNGETIGLRFNVQKQRLFKIKNR
jgi:hypothetical protein